MERQIFLMKLTQWLQFQDQAHAGQILRVGIDGVDGAGKTHLADELAAVLQEQGATVIRASVDGFHRPRALRYRLGPDSPEGFYVDSYDYPLLQRVLLAPLGPGGDGRYLTAAFDYRTDAAVEPVWQEAQRASILLFDGIFLHRPELRDVWDCSLFLAVDFAISVPRGQQRFPGPADPDPAALSNRRYVAGQKLYLVRCRPQEWASLLIDYNDLARPEVVGGCCQVEFERFGGPGLG